MDRPVVPDSPSIRFRTRRRTRWSDEDVQAVVNNSVHMTLLEEARYDYFSGLEGVQDQSFPFLLAQTNIAFRSPARGGREYDIEAVTTHLGKSSIVQAYRILDVRDASVIAEAEALLVCYDPQTGKSISMPEKMRVAVTSFEEL